MFLFLRALRALLASAALLGAAAACAAAPQTLAALAPSLAVGDIVFTRIPFVPFTKITEVTGGWANHVGVVIDVSGDEPLIAESKVIPPRSMVIGSPGKIIRQLSDDDVKRFNGAAGRYVANWKRYAAGLKPRS